MTRFLALLAILFQTFTFASSFVARTPTRPSWTKKTSTELMMGAILSGDKVLVVGGTGGVGQLVIKKLRANDFDVRVTSRDAERGAETIADDEVEVVEVDLLSDDLDPLRSALEGVSAVVVSVGTTAFPTLKWRGGNTPDAVDKVAVSNIAQCAAGSPTIKKIVLLTSVGVDRTGEMPFSFLNLFGVLDAKRAGEEAVKEASSESGKIEYVIIRPGRLVGGPYTNVDVASILKLEGGAENGVTVAAGDSLLGDCKRDACAEAVIQCLTNEGSANVEFSIISNDEKALSDQQWTEAFASMQA